MSGSRDAEYTEYVAARVLSLRRLAVVLCDDWQRADDLVQSALVKLYVHWGRVRTASHIDAYARAVLVRKAVPCAGARQDRPGKDPRPSKGSAPETWCGGGPATTCGTGRYATPSAQAERTWTISGGWLTAIWATPN